MAPLGHPQRFVRARDDGRADAQDREADQPLATLTQTTDLLLGFGALPQASRRAGLDREAEETMRRRSRLLQLALFTCVLWPAVGHAAPPPPPESAGDGEWTWQPAAHGQYLHDGFYLSLGLGAGLIEAQFANSAAVGRPWASGTGFATEIAIGGAIADGWTIGGRFLDVVSPSAQGVLRTEVPVVGGPPDTLSSYDARDLMWFSMAQLFVDAYPTPKRGLHLQAGVGPASLQFRSQQAWSFMGASSFGGSQKTNWGVGGSVGIGWDGWISPQWSAGVLLNLSAARLWGAPNAYDPNTRADVAGAITVLSPALLFKLTYN
jgi:hypothetical protein